MTMASEVKHGEIRIGLKVALIEPFVPIGCSRRTGKVRYWHGQMRRTPLRYVANNLAVIMTLLAYNELHQGGAAWEAIHIALAIPSTIFAGRGVAMMKRLRDEKASA